MLMAGTQTAMSLGWIIRYLFDFAKALPSRCDLYQPMVTSSSELEEEQIKKRKIDQPSSSDE